MIAALGPALRARLNALRYGFLFLPGLVALSLALLALVLTRVDSLGGSHGVAGFGGDASTARSILSTIAAALITVAGLTFSITVVSLQLVSQQFSPRALRNFLADRITQFVAGAFVGIFAYCLLVLRVVRQESPPPGFVPGLSVSVAIFLGVITLGLLLVFIHHMSQSIQLSTIASEIARSTLGSLQAIYPEPYGEPLEETSGPPASWHTAEPNVVISPSRAGYVQSISLGQLAHRLDGGSARVHVPVAPGDFVTPRTVVIELWCDDSESACRAARSAVTVANERDVSQDILYGIRQLADIAIRALSPGVNDPTTAVTCIDYLAATIEELSTRTFPSGTRTFEGSDVLAFVRSRTFAEHLEPLIETAWHARNDRRVSERLCENIERILGEARVTGASDHVEALRVAQAQIAAFA